jgi:hypothetical protein
MKPAVALFVALLILYVLFSGKGLKVWEAITT